MCLGIVVGAGVVEAVCSEHLDGASELEDIPLGCALDTSVRGNGSFPAVSPK